MIGIEFDEFRRDFFGLPKKVDRKRLRDEFAMAALQGMLASDSSVDRTKVVKSTWAKIAYEFADAMVAQRDK